jgi:hypothetical protein
LEIRRRLVDTGIVWCSGIWNVKKLIERLEVLCYFLGILESLSRAILWWFVVDVKYVDS